MTKLRATVSNQVFIGCPWKTVRPKYEKISDALNKKFPVSFAIIGREREHRAEELLGIIKSTLEKSSKAIFDATNSNANVSLEFGYAEAKDIDSAIYFCTHGRTGAKGAATAIISDLAGMRRKDYKNEIGLHRLLSEFCQNHPYTTRFEKLMRSKKSGTNRHKKKKFRALALKIIHFIDNKNQVRRDDIIDAITANDRYKYAEVDECIKRLHSHSLIIVSQGRYSDVRIA